MEENNLAYALALQSYARTLLALIRICSGLNKRDVAKRCGITSPLISQWLTGVRPMAPVHERALRTLLTQAIRDKRNTLAATGNGELRNLQKALLKAFVDLEVAWVALTREYAKSVQEMATTATALRDAMPAATPSVAAGLHEMDMHAQTSRAAIPGMWGAIKERTRALLGLVDPTAAADVRANVGDLLDYAEKVYGLEENEAIEQKGPKHRPRGRPKKNKGSVTV